MCASIVNRTQLEIDNEQHAAPMQDRICVFPSALHCCKAIPRIYARTHLASFFWLISVLVKHYMQQSHTCCCLHEVWNIAAVACDKQFWRFTCIRSQDLNSKQSDVESQMTHMNSGNKNVLLKSPGSILKLLEGYGYNPCVVGYLLV